MGTFDERDRSVIEALTKSITDLTSVLSGEQSFHQRQVPALRRQSEVLTLIRAKIAACKRETIPVVSKDGIILFLKKLEERLISS